METKYKRFYKVIDGITHRTSGQEPPDETWSRGIGPISADAEKRRFDGISAAHTGVPKTETQKEKMRLAKLDKPKTSTQKLAMSETHKLNAQLVRELRSTRPELGYYEALKIVVERKKMSK
jgi:hypothetical protein